MSFTRNEIRSSQVRVPKTAIRESKDHPDQKQDDKARGIIFRQT